MKLDSTTEPVIPFFDHPLVVVNIGIRPFYNTLKGADVDVYQVDWSIPAGGDQEILRVLDLLLE